MLSVWSLKTLKPYQALVFCSLILHMTAPATAGEPTPEGMVLIPPGEFVMGMEGASNKTPHTVSLDAFYLDTHEVTQENFEKARRYNPSKFIDPQRPVEQVTWYEAKSYCRKQGKRLPTEAEWERAARAGTTTKYFWGDDMDPRYAWFRDNADDQTHPAGQKLPNPFGLYDISGNVWEWTADWYDKTWYRRSPRKNPQGPEQGEEKVIRGGSWYSRKHHLLTATRYWSEPMIRNSNIGFRCAANAPDPR